MDSGDGSSLAPRLGLQRRRDARYPITEIRGRTWCRYNANNVGYVYHNARNRRINACCVWSVRGTPGGGLVRSAIALSGYNSCVQLIEAEGRALTSGDVLKPHPQQLPSSSS